MTRKITWFLPFATLIIFQSCAINKLYCGAFNTMAKAGDTTDNANYIIKEDGTKIYGKEIYYQYGLALRELVIIDGQRFKTSEVRAYQQDGDYYIRTGNRFSKRFVSGKLNVYLRDYTVYKLDSRTGVGHHEGRCAHYVQEGDSGKLVLITSWKQIKPFVADCPKSLKVISQKPSKIRKAIRKDPDYLNRVFENYNAGNCTIE